MMLQYFVEVNSRPQQDRAAKKKNCKQKANEPGKAHRLTSSFPLDGNVSLLCNNNYNVNVCGYWRLNEKHDIIC